MRIQISKTGTVASVREGLNEELAKLEGHEKAVARHIISDHIAPSLEGDASAKDFDRAKHEQKTCGVSIDVNVSVSIS